MFNIWILRALCLEIVLLEIAVYLLRWLSVTFGFYIIMFLWSKPYRFIEFEKFRLLSFPNFVTISLFLNTTSAINAVIQELDIKTLQNPNIVEAINWYIICSSHLIWTYMRGSLLITDIVDHKKFHFFSFRGKDWDLKFWTFASSRNGVIVGGLGHSWLPIFKCFYFFHLPLNIITFYMVDTVDGYDVTVPYGSLLHCAKVTPHMSCLHRQFL